MSVVVDQENGLENNFDRKTTDANTDGGNQLNCKDAENEQQKTPDKDAVDNGEDDIDPLDLIANCNEIGGDLISDNSDVWKCSDTDEESFTNQKDVDNHLIDSTVINLIDDNVIKESSKNNDNPDGQNGKNDDHNYGITDCLKQSDNLHCNNEDKDENNEDNKDTNKSLPADSPDCKENKLTDDLGVNHLNNENDKAATDECTNNVIVNDRTGDDSGDSGISDTITTQNKDKNDGEDKLTDNEKHNDDNDEMDYNDFDPSLLCPEVSMAIDEAAPIITETTTNNDCTSPLPYEPTFSTFVDEITGAEISFNLTPEEQEARAKRYTSVNPVEYTKIHCTACNLHLGSALEAQNNRFVHPLLKVLICSKCYNFYTSGEFEKDEDGSELYCRWCGQGGQVLCCSKCECVFCKKCIKTNFGRRKMNHIKNSDDWICFKCNPSQLSYQRIACYELFEYVRRETARAATLNDPEFLSTDYSVCCKMINQTDALVDMNKEKKKSKKKRNDDPEYDPFEENEPVVKKLKIISPRSVFPLNNNNNNTNNNNNNKNNITNNILTPITVTTSSSSSTILQPTAILLRPTSTIIQTSSRPINNMHRPHIINSQNFRPSAPTLFRINTTNQKSTPTTIFTTAPPLLYRAADISKHEWFEKTVRSTARVNAHLSYTLTQLNKAQSQAGSLEELAVVHNKLQEVLSSSINSLIQIRKNLRTEFITGIKKVRLPPRKFDCSTSSSSSNANKDDDDVIFVSAAPSTITISKPVLIANAVLPSSTTVNNNNNNVNKDIVTNNGEKRTGFLKVKSVFELQNVPSECITIPDEPSSPNTVVAEQQSTVIPTDINDGNIKVECGILTDKNHENIEKVPEIVQAPIKQPDTNTDLLKHLLESNKNEIGKVSTEQATPIVVKDESKIIDVESFQYNLNDPPTPIVRRMMSLYVRMERSPLIK